jgi:kynureninase
VDWTGSSTLTHLRPRTGQRRRLSTLTGMAHTIDALVAMQRVADEAHTRVQEMTTSFGKGDWCLGARRLNVNGMQGR